MTRLDNEKLSSLNTKTKESVGDTNIASVRVAPKRKKLPEAGRRGPFVYKFPKPDPSPNLFIDSAEEEENPVDDNGEPSKEIQSDC